MGLLLDDLTAYGDSDAYPFHMPGHKRNENGSADDFWKEYYKRDITEIDGFDNLHHAEGILKEAMERARDLYGSEETYFLINGSTAGILTALCAAVEEGDSILMMRGSHRSAYHGIGLHHINAIYLASNVHPEMGLDMGITLEQLKGAYELHPEIKAVFLTSPTYEGITISLRKMAEWLHERNIILIVDAAHGAHFGMADFLPENAVDAGADLVIHSLHKTLPSPTQTALLHVNGNLVNRKKVRQYLGIFQSSSPSYVLMAGIDECIDRMTREGTVLWKEFYEHRMWLRDKLKGLKKISVFETDTAEKMLPDDCGMDPGKILLVPDSKYLNARELYDILRVQYHLQAEMVTPAYVLLFLTVMDRKEGYKRLAAALMDLEENLEVKEEIAQKLTGKKAVFDKVSSGERKDNREETGNGDNRYILPEMVYPLSEAYALQSKGVWKPEEEAIGRISMETVMAYPPGQPLLLPGERISKEVIRQINRYMESGCEILGLGNHMEFYCLP